MLLPLPSLPLVTAERKALSSSAGRATTCSGAGPLPPLPPPPAPPPPPTPSPWPPLSLPPFPERALPPLAPRLPSLPSPLPAAALAASTSAASSLLLTASSFACIAGRSASFGGSTALITALPPMGNLRVVSSGSKIPSSELSVVSGDPSSAAPAAAAAAAAAAARMAATPSWRRHSQRLYTGPPSGSIGADPAVIASTYTRVCGPRADASVA